LNNKPLNIKAYGSIPHLPNSKLGTGDHSVNPGVARILTQKLRDKDEHIIVQVKLDGSCVAVTKYEGAIVPLIRSGYRADSSHYSQHHVFAAWVYERQDMFDSILEEGDRICGEWLYQAHGVRYGLQSTELLFAPFDIFKDNKRILYKDILTVLKNTSLTTPALLHRGDALSVEMAIELLQYQSIKDCVRWACSPDRHEGFVYRCEKKGKVEILAKWVRSDFESGKYLPGINPQIKEPVLNLVKL
jgi:hypothetical protein